jgi:hypothetical protein
MREVKLLATLLLFPLFLARAEVRLGIVGTGGSLVAFTQILNDASDADHVPGARVVAAYRGGRADKIGDELHTKWKVDITPDIGSLCRKVDAVLIASDDPVERLVQIKAVIAAGKPLFIEDPVAASLEDARLVAKLAKDAGVKWFSASAIRFGEVLGIKGSYVAKATTWGTGSIDRSHAAEMLYALMGTGCESVSWAAGSVVGRWPGDRVGTVLLAPPDKGWGASVLPRGKTRIVQDYRSLLVETVKFFETGAAPVSHEETLEIAAFLDAAERSKAAAGEPTKLR